MNFENHPFSFSIVVIEADAPQVSKTSQSSINIISDIINLIESDETLSTCQMFNAEVCYGSGLVYDTELATAQVQAQVDDFMLDNDLASYFLGVCQDFKHFGFCVSVIILNEDASRIRLAKGQRIRLMETV